MTSIPVPEQISGGSHPVVDLLRARGVRVTASRVAVLTAVDEQPHIDADAVAHVVRDRLGAVSTQAVYDALALFTSLGVVRRIKPAGSTSRYETRVDDNHHHVLCRNCGLIANVDCAVGPSPCLTPAATHGFLIDEAEVVYWGLCTTCQQARPEPLPDTGAHQHVPNDHERHNEQRH